MALGLLYIMVPHLPQYLMYFLLDAIFSPTRLAFNRLEPTGGRGSLSLLSDGQMSSDVSPYEIVSILCDHCSQSDLDLFEYLLSVITTDGYLVSDVPHRFDWATSQHQPGIKRSLL